MDRRIKIKTVLIGVLAAIALTAAIVAMSLCGVFASAASSSKITKTIYAKNSGEGFGVEASATVTFPSGTTTYTDSDDIDHYSKHPESIDYYIYVQCLSSAASGSEAQTIGTFDGTTIYNFYGDYDNFGDLWASDGFGETSGTFTPPDAFMDCGGTYYLYVYTNKGFEFKKTDNYKFIVDGDKTLIPIVNSNTTSVDGNDDMTFYYSMDGLTRQYNAYLLFENTPSGTITNVTNGSVFDQSLVGVVFYIPPGLPRTFWKGYSWGHIKSAQIEFQGAYNNTINVGPINQNLGDKKDYDYQFDHEFTLNAIYSLVLFDTPVSANGRCNITVNTYECYRYQPADWINGNLTDGYFTEQNAQTFVYTFYIDIDNIPGVKILKSDSALYASGSASREFSLYYGWDDGTSPYYTSSGSFNTIGTNTTEWFDVGGAPKYVYIKVPIDIFWKYTSSSYSGTKITANFTITRSDDSTSYTTSGSATYKQNYICLNWPSSIEFNHGVTYTVSIYLSSTNLSLTVNPSTKAKSYSFSFKYGIDGEASYNSTTRELSVIGCGSPSSINHTFYNILSATGTTTETTFTKDIPVGYKGEITVSVYSNASYSDGTYIGDDKDHKDFSFIVDFGEEYKSVKLQDSSHTIFGDTNIAYEFDLLFNVLPANAAGVNGEYYNQIPVGFRIIVPMSQAAFCEDGPGAERSLFSYIYVGGNEVSDLSLYGSDKDSVTFAFTFGDTSGYKNKITANGDWTITVEGLYSSNDTFTWEFHTDAISPTLSNVGATIYRNTSYTVTATDANGVTLYVKTPGSSKFTSVYNSSAASYEIKDTATEGEYMFYAVDVAGNSAGSEDVCFIVCIDRTAPVIKSFDLSDTTAQKIVAEDALSGVEYIYVGSYRFYGSPATVTPEDIGYGYYTVYAVDRAGNISDTVEFMFSSYDVKTGQIYTDSNGICFVWDDPTLTCTVEGEPYESGTYFTKHYGDDQSSMAGVTYHFILWSPDGSDWEDHTGNLTHIFEDERSAASCGQEGYILHTCSIPGCGYSYRSDFVAAMSHQFTYAITEATCTEPGKEAYKCQICGYEDVVDISPATGHYYWSETHQATCTTLGYTHYVCQYCGDEYDSVFGDALKAHTYNAVAYTEPTCCDAGYRTYECSVCGDSYTEDLDPLGHDYYLYETTTLSFINSDGNEDVELIDVYTCRFCGDTYSTISVDRGIAQSIVDWFDEYQQYIWWLFLIFAVAWSAFMGIKYATSRNGEQAVAAKTAVMNYILGLLVIALICVCVPYLVYGVAAFMV